MIKLEIISAEAKRAELEAIRIAEELERKQREALRGQRVEQLTVKVFNIAKRAIEETQWDHCEAIITEVDLTAWGRPDYNELGEAIRNVADLLTLAGYRCDSFHEYSVGWRNRNGKYGYLYIRID